MNKQSLGSFSQLISLLKLFIIFYLPETQRDKKEKKEWEGKKGIFYLLVYSPKAYNNQGWTRLNPGAPNAIWNPQLGGRHWSTWALTGCLPGCMGRWLDWQQGSRELKQHSDWGCPGPRGVLNHCTTVLPCIFFAFKHSLKTLSSNLSNHWTPDERALSHLISMSDCCS